MKVSIAYLLLGILAVANAAPSPAVNYEADIEVVIKDLQEFSQQTPNRVEQQFKRIVVAPLDAVDLAVQNIDDQRAEHAACVAPKDPAIASVVDAFHENMYECGAVAAKASTQIVSDISKAAQQLVFDGYHVLRLYQKCKKYKNSILRKSCQAKLTVQATLYLKNARKSLKTIKGANQRIPPIFAEADVCTHNFAEEAIMKLESINIEIDACIEKNI